MQMRFSFILAATVVFLAISLVAQSSVAQSSDGAPSGQGNQRQTSPSSSSSSQRSSDVQATIAAAHEKLEKGDPQEAIAMLEQVVAAAKSSSPGLQHELGIAYYRTSKLVPAEKAFAQAMADDPSDMESVQMRGLTLYRLGRPADAIPYLERVREWTPNANTDANHVLGLCYLNSRRFDDARKAFANQFGVRADSAPAYLLLGNMLMQANLPEAARDAAKKALELAPQIPLAHFLLGEFYLFKSDIPRALDEFNAEREINPANAAVYDRLGDAYTRSGLFQQAQEALAEALSLDTSSTGPFIQMGKVLLRRDDPRTSLLYLEHAEKMDPGNYITHTLLGQAYRRLGREDEAKKELNVAGKIHADTELKLQPAE